MFGTDGRGHEKGVLNSKIDGMERCEKIRELQCFLHLSQEDLLKK